MYRNPRLESILGCRVDELDAARINDLVTQRIPEDLTLEFKRDDYASKSRNAWSELAKDVVALANAAGGLLLLGVAETGGVASKIVGVEVGDSREKRLRDEIVARVSPFPAFEVTSFPLQDDAKRGVIGIMVPAGSSAPYGIRLDDAWKWPIRHGSHTRYMDEAELAQRYRDRDRRLRDRDRRLEAIFDEGVAARGDVRRSWLAIAMVPDAAGNAIDSDFGRDPANQWLASLSGQLPLNLLVGPAAGIGRQRVIFSDQNTTPRSKDRRLEVYRDGSSFAMLAIGKQGDSSDDGFEEREVGLDVDRFLLESWVTYLLRLQALWASNAGAAGDLQARACLMRPLGAGGAEEVPATSPSEIVQLRVSEPFRRLADSTPLGHRWVPGSHGIVAPRPVVETLPSVIAVDDADLIRSAAGISADLLSEFDVEGLKVISHDGTVRAVDGYQAVAPLVGWARSRGLVPDVSPG